MTIKLKQHLQEKNGVKLPSYRGDNINGDSFDEKSRIPDPQRMIRAYCQAAATLNLLRAFATGGYAAMQRVTQWNLDFTDHSEQGDRYLFILFICNLQLQFFNFCWNWNNTASFEFVVVFIGLRFPDLLSEFSVTWNLGWLVSGKGSVSRFGLLSFGLRFYE